MQERGHAHSQSAMSKADDIADRRPPRAGASITCLGLPITEDKPMTSVTLKGKAVELAGSFIRKGQIAPDFTLIDGDLKERNLASLGDKEKIFSIVPSLDTPVCSLMAKKFYQALQSKQNVVLVVVSADLPFAQKRICGVEHLEKNIIPLSAFRSKTFGEDWGVLIKNGPLQSLLARAVVVLDKSNKVIYAELVSEITLEPNYEQALLHLKSSA